MLKHPPDARFDLEQAPELEEGAERFVRGFDGGFDVGFHAGFGVFGGLQEHEAVEVVGGEKEVLADLARVYGGLLLQGVVVEDRKGCREGFVEAFKCRDEGVLVPGAVGYGQGEGEG